MDFLVYFLIFLWIGNGFIHMIYISEYFTKDEGYEHIKKPSVGAQIIVSLLFGAILGPFAAITAGKLRNRLDAKK